MDGERSFANMWSMIVRFDVNDTQGAFCFSFKQSNPFYESFFPLFPHGRPPTHSMVTSRTQTLPARCNHPWSPLCFPFFISFTMVWGWSHPNTSRMPAVCVSHEIVFWASVPTPWTRCSLTGDSSLRLFWLAAFAASVFLGPGAVVTLGASFLFSVVIYVGRLRTPD